MRRKMVGARGVKLLCVLTILLVALAGTGAVYQALASAVDRQRLPAPGQMVDMDGYKLRLNCTGAGTPTVILEAGLGDSGLVWSKVQPDVAAFTRVCSYDRAGYGWSDAGPTPRDGKEVVAELHTLLMKAGIQAPYVLVGHSLGGLYTRLYASIYPQQVAGMVLVDATSEDQQLDLSPQQRSFINQDIRSHYEYQWLAVFGIPRLALQLNLEPGGQSSFNDYPLSVLPGVKAYESQPRFFRAYADERLAFDETATEVRSSARDLGNMPLVVISHGLPVPTSLQLQESQARLSSRGVRVVATHSGHYVQLEQPDLVIDAIRQVSSDSGR